MQVNLSPIGNGFQFLTSGGLPLNAGTLATYLAGTSTPAVTYTTSTGTVENANPIVLNTDGRTPQEIWLIAGQAYKFVLKDSLGNLIATYDNLSGINDPTGVVNQWLPAPTVTYVSASSFTVTGNQIAMFQVGRRIKFVLTGGIYYGTVETSTFGSLTTVTLTQDSDTLDNTVSALYYSVLTALNQALPRTVAITRTISADEDLSVGQSGQTFFSTAKATAQIPSATNAGWKGKFFGNSAGLTLTTGLIPPPAPTLSSVAGGTIAATTYYIRASITSAEGQESVPGAEASLAVAADYLPSAASPSTTLPNATWSAYASTSAGTETLQQSGIAIGTAWTMPTTGLVSGAAMPSSQGGNIVTPDGTASTSLVFSDTEDGCLLIADGTNYRAQTFGPTIVAPATASNQAVNLGQFPASLSGNGYQKLASGLIIQWGGYAPADADTVYDVTLPIAFPTGGTALLVTPGVDSTTVATGQGYFVNSSTIGLIGNTASVTLNWLAIGY